MPEEYTQEQLWKLYEKLPQELKEAIFSEETAENIFSICIRNGIDDERISEIACYTGRILMGLLPLEEFQTTLVEKLNLEESLAKRINHEIYRFVLAPVKDKLAELYGKEISPPEKLILQKEKRIEKPPPQKDIYREPIE